MRQNRIAAVLVARQRAVRRIDKGEAQHIALDIANQGC